MVEGGPTKNTKGHEKRGPQCAVQKPFVPFRVFRGPKLVCSELRTICSPLRARPASSTANLSKMKAQFLTVAALAALATSIGLAVEETNPIKDAMKFAHKAPQGEKKLSDKI